jgi:hypothetical protein
MNTKTKAQQTSNAQRPTPNSEKDRDFKTYARQKTAELTETLTTEKLKRRN